MQNYIRYLDLCSMWSTFLHAEAPVVFNGVLIRFTIKGASESKVSFNRQDYDQYSLYRSPARSSPEESTGRLSSSPPISGDSLRVRATRLNSINFPLLKRWIPIPRGPYRAILCSHYPSLRELPINDDELLGTLHPLARNASESFLTLFPSAFTEDF